MNAGAVDQLIAVAMQSGTHAARPADTASCAASSHVSLAGPAGSLLVHAWYWSMHPPPKQTACEWATEWIVCLGGELWRQACRENRSLRLMPRNRPHCAPCR